MARKISPLKLNEAGVKAAIQADDAKRVARGVARRAVKAATAQALKDAEHQRVESERLVRLATKDVNAEHAAALAAQRIDFEALMPEDKNFEEYLADQGINPDGSPMEADDAPVKTAREQKYFGPMVALKTARLRYVKAANGIQCNGDAMATLLGDMKREDVVITLIRAMKLEGNPYSHLNPGQQSMNLRNKARGMIKNGTLSMVEIATAKTDTNEAHGV